LSLGANFTKQCFVSLFKDILCSGKASFTCIYVILKETVCKEIWQRKKPTYRCSKWAFVNVIGLFDFALPGEYHLTIKD